MSIAKKINAAGRKLCKELESITVGLPVTHVYNPLEYARKAHEAYVLRYGASKKRALFLGMNPGPWGMVQTGVPFGEVALVRDWLAIEATIEKPQREHPKRPVKGFACTRSEVSGKRLWGAIAEHFGEPAAFFEDFFVANYCPLVFMEESGRNRTPDKLPAHEREPIFAACDGYLRKMVTLLEPELVIGIGKFAENRTWEACRDMSESGQVRIASILHPSPANPRANAGWAGAAAEQLCALGVCRGRGKKE